MTDPKNIRVLFVCVHNSGRSRMAEALVNNMGQGRFEAMSAGLEPRPAHPLVAQIMNEIGLDITQKPPNSVFELFKQGRIYDYVITVCAETESLCPIFPGVRRRLSWPFHDPAEVSGTQAEQLAQIRIIRDQIKHQVEQWINKISAP